jgi:hypothetical protein
MTAIDRTAYPRFKESYTGTELHNLYTPTPEEIFFAHDVANSDSQRLTLLVWLKCCQSLGYNPAPEDNSHASSAACADGCGFEARRIFDLCP